MKNINDLIGLKKSLWFWISKKFGDGGPILTRNQINEFGSKGTEFQILVG